MDDVVELVQEPVVQKREVRMGPRLDDVVEVEMSR